MFIWTRWDCFFPKLDWNSSNCFNCWDFEEKGCLDSFYEVSFSCGCYFFLKTYHVSLHEILLPYLKQVFFSSFIWKMCNLSSWIGSMPSFSYVLSRLSNFSNSVSGCYEDVFLNILELFSDSYNHSKNIWDKLWFSREITP